MRREFLKNLGIEDKEVIDKILDENMADIGVAKGKGEADKEHLEKQITELTAQLKERDSQLEKLKDVDVDKLNGEIERLQAENKTAKEESDRVISKMKLESSIKDAFLFITSYLKGQFEDQLGYVSKANGGIKGAAIGVESLLYLSEGMKAGRISHSDFYRNFNNKEMIYTV